MGESTSSSSRRRRNQGRVVDLTLTVSPQTKMFPGSPQPTFVAWSRLDVQGYDSETIHMSTHTGTHVDAPSHFAKGKQTIDEISVSRFISDAILIRVHRRREMTNSLIEIDDILDEEVNRGDTVVFVTGWEKEYRKAHYMTKNPGLSSDAATYLMKKGVGAVAIDGPSIDVGHDSKFTAHNILLPLGIIAIENLCNLDKLGNAKKFTLIVAPLKLAGASGSPVRALALLS